MFNLFGLGGLGKFVLVVWGGDVVLVFCVCYLGENGGSGSGSSGGGCIFVDGLFFGFGVWGKFGCVGLG